MKCVLALCNVLVATSVIGCAADDIDTAEEDAIADGVPTGKSDSAFPLGWHHNWDIQYEDDEPLFAFFHEDGSADVTTFVTSYDTSYVTGKFSVYKYRGRDRVRLKSESGRVLFRSDWSINDDGDLVLGEREMGEAKPDVSPAGEVNCTAMRVVDTSMFEEGFTEYEYPDFGIEKNGSSWTIDMGSGDLDASDGTLTHEDNASELVVKLDMGMDQRLEVIVDKGTVRRGVINYQEDADDSLHLMANLVCR